MKPDEGLWEQHQAGRRPKILRINLLTHSIGAGGGTPETIPWRDSPATRRDGLTTKTGWPTASTPTASDTAVPAPLLQPVVRRALRVPSKFDIRTYHGQDCRSKRITVAAHDRRASRESTFGFTARSPKEPLGDTRQTEEVAAGNG